MVHAVIYCMRGWIAFVAFIELSNAIRCFIDEDKFLRGNIFNDNPNDESERVTSITARVLGRYYLLNCVVMSHCALFIHHLPIIALSVGALTLSILLYGSEAFYYYTAPVNFYVLFPITISLVTIICLLIAPMFLEPEVKRRKPLVQLSEDEESDEELRVIKQKQATTLPNFVNRNKKTQ